MKPIPMGNKWHAIGRPGGEFFQESLPGVQRKKNLPNRPLNWVVFHDS